MNKLLIFLSVILFSFSSAVVDVPAVVIKAFENKFPGAEKVKWEQDKNGRCDAKFKWNDKKCSASFTSSGEWLRTETILSYKDLPLNVKKAINTKYIVGSISGASKIEIPKGISYGVEFKHGYSPEWTQYSEDGTEL